MGAIVKAKNLLFQKMGEGYSLARGAMLRRRFDSVGEGLSVRGRVVIHGRGKIHAGTNLSLKSKLYPIEIYAGDNATITIGNNVRMNQGVTISAQMKIDIGDETRIGDQTTIYDTDWHGIDGNEPKMAPVKIENHVWICARTLVLKGVIVGENSIIGAGSVVAKNVAKNTIVAGNPAKKIGSTETGYSGARVGQSSPRKEV